VVFKSYFDGKKDCRKREDDSDQANLGLLTTLSFWRGA
jgi:hypothetical protein